MLFRPAPYPPKELLLALILGCFISLKFNGAYAQQTITGTFQGAFQAVIPNGAGSPAVKAQCPGNAPSPCTNIDQPYWCCPWGNTCGWNGNAVGCCPNGQWCSGGGAAGGGAAGGGQWHPTTTYYQPTQTETVYQQSTVYTTAPTETTVAPQEAQKTTAAAGAAAGGSYCSTIYETGPGLPTTAAGQCGTILILPANEGTPTVAETFQLAAWVSGGIILHSILWLFFLVG